MRTSGTEWLLSVAVSVSSLVHSEQQQLAAVILHFVTL